MTQKKQTIFFILNTIGLTGGVKVIFEHANRFEKKGYNIKIIHLLRLKKGCKGYLIGVIKKIKYLSIRILKKNFKPDWFILNDNIEVNHSFSLNKIKSGIVIATANETADWVNKLKSDKIKKFYFIQDYETWTREESLVHKTYKYPIKKIVSSSWLQNILKEKFKEDSFEPVFNGVDYEKFCYTGNKEINNHIRILIMNHVVPKKGFKEGMEALRIVKNKFPNIEIISFGAYPLNTNLDIISEYHYKPTLEELKKIYHSANIFLCPSNQEGFTLPPMEAMAAQCAVVCTNVGGPTDYCINEKTGLLVQVGDIQKMSQAIINLIENPNKLKDLAINGQRYIKDFTWDKFNNTLENILLKN